MLAGMSSYPRYALYYMPDRSSELYRFGARTIGYDAFTGKEVAFPPDLLHGQPDWRELTNDPRRYGFHATLKAPFSLRSDMTEADLLAAIEEFSGQGRVIPVIAPVVRSIGSFVAIVPSEPNSDLNALARDCVVGFDGFRAPLTPQDRARRNHDALTPAQREHLGRWGYPYVMDDFRFHMTLTGSLPAPRREVISAMLKTSFLALNVATLVIDKLALLKQEHEHSRFEVVALYDLG
ncbi:putative phosphonate metabolism protein [Afipia felis]|uniref:Phosphonate metabolism protein n=1 Tax=Afipia felis TaxID=1035 RepID=A0A090MTA3_AFIFE|nr:putative phosphonate metabolism protein [Afipia felis]